MSEKKIKLGDMIKCADPTDVIDTWYAIRDEIMADGMDVEFVYEKDGEKGYWLKIVELVEKKMKSINTTFFSFVTLNEVLEQNQCDNVENVLTFKDEPDKEFYYGVRRKKREEDEE